MIKSNNLRCFCAILAILLTLDPGLEARTKKGDKFFKDGQAAEGKQLFDDAVDFYEKAVSADPRDPGYLLALRRAKFQSGQKHVDTAMKLREQGQLEAAITEFQKAILRDPSSAIALQEWKRTSEMLEKEKASGKGPGPNRGMTPVELYRKETEDRVASMMSPPEIKPISAQIPGGLKMNNQPVKVLYETVGKLAGINVVFDQQMQSTSRFNVDIQTNTGIEQALDYLAVLTKTFWKAISTNTIFVTEDNVTKRRDYEDNVVKVFYVQNATSVQEFQEIATAVRSLTEIRRVYTYNAQRAILMRGTPDQIALAEKLIYDLDKAKAEVVIDVIVMEADRSKTRDLAAAIMSAGAAGLNVPIQFTPRNPVLVNGNNSGSSNNGSSSGDSGLLGSSGSAGTPTTQSLVSLAQLGRISTNDFSTTLPGALLNLVMSDRTTKVLQSPQVRASDGQKVTLRIGDKIPYATGSFQPGVGTVGVSPLVSTQFNFAEVGVNVDITPQVHGNNEVTLKVAVEVSNVRDRVSIGGVDQPVIGQRRNETEIRLRNGEVNILGGLSQASDTKSLSGIPGLVNIPILGRLLGSESIDKETGELLIAIVPHIVRTPNLSEVNLKTIAAGTDQTPHVQYAPKEPAAGPTTAPGPTAPVVTTPAAPPSPTTQPPIPGLPNPAGARLTFSPGAAQAQLGGMITVMLQAENVNDLFSAAPVRIKFDPKLLRLNEIMQGELLTKDNQKTTFSKDIRNDTGEAWFTVNRLPGGGGANGSGTLATFTFTAIGKGQAAITLPEVALKNTKLEPVAVSQPTLNVVIQ